MINFQFSIIQFSNIELLINCINKWKLEIENWNFILKLWLI